MFSIYIVFVNLLFYNMCESNHLYTQFCDKSCTSGGVTHTHTVCQRASEQCAPSSACGTVTYPLMTDDVRQAIIDKHNELRNKVASGKETINAQPAASNMNVLNYNFELEFIAQCLANTCKFEHDKCRRGLSLNVGQNIAWKGNSRVISPSDIAPVLSSIQSWYSEVSTFDPNNIDSFKGGSSGHYTQLVWATAEYIGCGRILYKKGGWNNMLLVCNYGSYGNAGNMLGASMYKKGGQASACENGKRANSKYRALCGEVIPLDDIDRGMFGKATTVTPFYNQKLVSLIMNVFSCYFFTKILL